MRFFQDQKQRSLASAFLLHSTPEDRVVKDAQNGSDHIVDDARGDAVTATILLCDLLQGRPPGQSPLIHKNGFAVRNLTCELKSNTHDQRLLTYSALPIGR